MMNNQLLSDLMAISASKTLRRRLILTLLKALSLRADRTELVIPLQSSCCEDNTSALDHWLDQQEDDQNPSPGVLLNRLQSQLKDWEGSRWDD